MVSRLNQPVPADMRKGPVLAESHQESGLSRYRQGTRGDHPEPCVGGRGFPLKDTYVGETYTSPE